MPRPSFINVLLTFLLLQIPALVSAHEVEVCLARLAQKSGQLKACRVAQTEKTQCDAIAARLEEFRQRCIQEQHPPEYIARAIAFGASDVAGNPDRSPYQQQVARQHWEQTQIGPNVQRFSVLFPGFEHFRPALAEHFGTAACPTAYEGKQGRWLHTASMTLQRYGMAESTQSAPTTVRQHFFGPEASNRCYPIPPLSEGHQGSVINIPDLMLQELEKQGVAVRCSSEDCASTLDEVNQLYQQYQGAYREYRQLMVCADTAQRNAGRGQVKGAARSATPLPDYCPEKEIDVAYLNAKGLVEELERRLFGPHSTPPVQAKGAQN